MTNQVVQAQYDQLDAVARRFDRQADANARMLAEVVQWVNVLRQGSWAGRGQDGFLREMDADVLPAVRRLGVALTEASRVLVEISAIMQAADEDAAQPFRTGEKPTGADVLGSQAVIAASDKVSQGLPPPPPPPPAPLAGDGSGQHGTTAPTASDYANRELFYGIADGADTIGMDNAARNMRHYLDNSGQPLNMNPNAMLHDLPGFRDEANERFQRDVVDSVNRRIAQEYKGEPMRFPIAAPWRHSYATKAESQDWFFATGGFSYAYGAEAVVTPGPGGVPTVQIEYQMHVFDRYNWDQGKGVDIGPFRVGDAQLGRLHEAGIAQEYELRGSSAPRSYQYTYGGTTRNDQIWLDPGPSGRPGGVSDNPSRNPDEERGARGNR